MSGYSAIDIFSETNAEGDGYQKMRVNGFTGSPPSQCNLIDDEDGMVYCLTQNGISEGLRLNHYDRSAYDRSAATSPDESQAQSLSLSDSSSKALESIHCGVGDEGYDKAADCIAEAISNGELLSEEVSDLLADVMGIDRCNSGDALSDTLNTIIDEVRSDAGNRMIKLHGFSPEEVNDFAEWLIQTGQFSPCFIEGSRGRTDTLDALAKFYRNKSIT
jgi:hypothetical protein